MPVALLKVRWLSTKHAFTCRAVALYIHDLPETESKSQWIHWDLLLSKHVIVLLAILKCDSLCRTILYICSIGSGSVKILICVIEMSAFTLETLYIFTFCWLWNWFGFDLCLRRILGSLLCLFLVRCFAWKVVLTFLQAGRWISTTVKM